MTSPVGCPLSLCLVILPQGEDGAPPPGSRARREASCTELLRKVCLPDSRQRPGRWSCRPRWQQREGTVLSCQHWVRARPVPQTLPLPKSLTEVSWPHFPWGLPSLHSRPSREVLGDLSWGGPVLQTRCPSLDGYSPHSRCAPALLINPEATRHPPLHTHIPPPARRDLEGASDRRKGHLALAPPMPGLCAASLSSILKEKTEPHVSVVPAGQERAC